MQSKKENIQLGSIAGDKMDYENFDFYDLISVLIKNKKFIFLISFIVMVLSIIYLTFSSNLWVSQVKAQPLVSPSSIELSSLKNTTLSELTRGLRQTQQDIEGDRLIMIISSRPFLEKIINKFNLYEYLKIDKKDKSKEEKRDIALKKLRTKMLSINYYPDNSLLEISVTTKNRILSSQIANYIVELLDYNNIYERKTKGKESRILIENRLNLIQDNIKQYENQLEQFKSENSIINIDDQSIAVLKQYTDLESQRIQLKIELDVLKLKYDGDNSKLVYLNSTIQKIEDELKNLEMYGNHSYILTLDKIPILSKQYFALETKLQIEKLVYDNLYPQLEMARIDESKELTTLNIIENAVPSGENILQKKIIQFLIINFLSFFFVSLYVLYKELFYLKRSNNSEIDDKLKKIYNDIF